MSTLLIVAILLVEVLILAVVLLIGVGCLRRLSALEDALYEDGAGSVQVGSTIDPTKG